MLGSVVIVALAGLTCIVVARGPSLPADLVAEQAQRGDEPELYLPGLVSTAAHEFCVRFSRGMDELLLMRSTLDYHVGILRFRHVQGTWSAPELARVPSPGGVAYPFLAPDGSRIFFDVRETPAGGGPPDSNIWTAERADGGWARPTGVAAVNSPSVEMYASVAANGNLYFCSNRPGGLGGFDIYRAVAVPGGYAQPENLGVAVNSAENDFHPFIAPDERYLLFDAQRADGFGSNDLFLSVRGPDGTWGRAVNLGPGINTRAGEMRPYVAPDGRTLFFCSDRGIGAPQTPPVDLGAFLRRVNGPGNGSQDIYRVGVEVVERVLSNRVQR